MHEPKIKSFHTFIRGIDDIILFLLLTHCIPLPLPDLVAPDIKRLDEVEENNVEAADT